MTKKNLQVEVAVRVLGKELTRAEAEELYRALGSALGKTYTLPYTPFVPYVRPYWNSDLIGNPAPGPFVTTCGSASTSAMVEKIVN